MDLRIEGLNTFFFLSFFLHILYFHGILQRDTTNYNEQLRKVYPSRPTCIRQHLKDVDDKFLWTLVSSTVFCFTVPLIPRVIPFALIHFMRL